MSYWLHILISFEIYVILALAMNLLGGFTGLLSLSQAASYGIGAYVYGLFTTSLGWGFATSAGMAMLGAVLFSIPVIICAVRLRGLFFALGTLAFQAIVFAILYNWVSVTHGPYGISGIPRPVFFGHMLNDLPSMALFGAGTGGLVVAFFLWMRRTPLMRLLQGVRDDQLALMGLGRDPRRYKTIAIVIASACTGLAGALFASYYSYIDPTSFSLEESILILSIVLIGGAGSIIGSIAGAAFYVLLPELLRFLQLPENAAPHARMMIYAAVLILVVLYRPNGFFGTYRFTPAAS